MKQTRMTLRLKKDNQDEIFNEFLNHVIDRASEELNKEDIKVFEQGDIVTRNGSDILMEVQYSDKDYTVCIIECPGKFKQQRFTTSDLSIANTSDYNDELPLPSQFQIGEEVLFIPTPHKLKNQEVSSLAIQCQVIAVHFSEEVFYDLSIYYENGNYYEHPICNVHHSKVFPIK